MLRSFITQTKSNNYRNLLGNNVNVSIKSQTLDIWMNVNSTGYQKLPRIYAIKSYDMDYQQHVQSVTVGQGVIIDRNYLDIHQKL